jgi:hypothetical protein
LVASRKSLLVTIPVQSYRYNDKIMTLLVYINILIYLPYNSWSGWLLVSLLLLLLLLIRLLLLLPPDTLLLILLVLLLLGGRSGLQSPLSSNNCALSVSGSDGTVGAALYRQK